MEKHDHRHKEELLQQMRRQAEIRPEQNDSEPAASSDTGTFKTPSFIDFIIIQ